MNATRRSSLKTLIYADIFNYPLTKKELKKWLIANSKLDLKTFKKTKSYYHLKGRSQIVNLRLQRQRFSKPKLKKARKIAKILGQIPSIKLIAVTGALAMNNSDKNDDIDLMIVTKTNRLWSTRLLAITILEFFRTRRQPGSKDSSQHSNKICLNLFLDESALAIPKSRQDLYTAHEVCQVKPLIDKEGTYNKFLSLNSWVKNYLPNAIDSNISNSKPSTPKRIPLLDKLNFLFFKLQYLYMKSKITNEKVSLHSAFFHPYPTGKIVLDKYNQKLKNLSK